MAWYLVKHRENYTFTFAREVDVKTSQDATIVIS